MLGSYSNGSFNFQQNDGLAEVLMITFNVAKVTIQVTAQCWLQVMFMQCGAAMHV